MLFLTKEVQEMESKKRRVFEKELAGLTVYQNGYYNTGNSSVP